MKKPLAFVIEDQPSLSTLYEDALRLVGFDVIAIRDGLEALNKLELNEPPTFIILDINLPSLSGRDLLQHIRKHTRYNNTPVMILTANSVMANAIRPEISKNDHLYIKPIGMKALQDFAKTMRPGKSGVADHLAETQKIPPLPEFDDEEESEETAKNLIDIIKPDNSITIHTGPTIETKLESKEHQVIITPDDDLVDAQTGEKLSTGTVEQVDTQTEAENAAATDDTKATIDTEKASTSDNSEVQTDTEKAPETDGSEAQSDSKSESS
jgi:DNA-binding response OmpR family regulator